MRQPVHLAGDAGGLNVTEAWLLQQLNVHLQDLEQTLTDPVATSN
jgi:hypothetical protein